MSSSYFWSDKEVVLQWNQFFEAQYPNESLAWDQIWNCF